MLLKAKYKKEKGILLPLSSLPSPHGIGDLGQCAYDFMDFLNETGQSYWQMLPLCPLGKGNSPYYSTGTFGGEILYIDLFSLVNDGLLRREEIGNPIFPKNVDYPLVRAFKIPLLRLAVSRFNPQNGEFLSFKRQNSHWLRDFALFMAIKEVTKEASFLNWEEGLKFRLPQKTVEFISENKSQILFYEICQYLFFKQYDRLLAYAHSKGIKIIGDIPFYVSPESADTWQNPQVFKLGRDMTPTHIAGVPPDIFSADGQLWGNPIYNWDYLKQTDYLWWRQRLLQNARLYDVIRIDHFRAFANYYSIPAGSKTARQGNWVNGVGLAFWDSVKPYIKNTEIIAEDLGGENDRPVQELVSQTGFPNMKVLQFAFNGNSANPFLPKNFAPNCVCYTGTHDNNTTLGWYKNLSENELKSFNNTVPKRFASPVYNLISFCLKSKARISIIPLQDYMNLGEEARMNTPGCPTGNWEWRYSQKELSAGLKKTVLSI